jgi:hypothetical protein
MSKPIPSYLFHIPHMSDAMNYEELEKRMMAKCPPETVVVIDAVTRKRIGGMHPSTALIKFR